VTTPSAGSRSRGAGTTKKLLSIQGNRTVTEFMRELGTLMWNNCGWRASKESLTEAIAKIPAIRDEFLAERQG